MKTLLGAASALAMMIGAGPAFADEVTGKIESFDAEAMTLVLETGETFTLAEEVSLEGFEAGQEVRVAYEQENGALRATAVELIEAAAAEEQAPEATAEVLEETTAE